MFSNGKENHRNSRWLEYRDIVERYYFIYKKRFNFFIYKNKKLYEI